MSPPRRVQKPGMRFLDIGFGKGERIAAYAERPRSKNRFFVGIDIARRKDLAISARMPNVKLVFGKVVKKISKMPDKNFNVINMDFFEIIRRVGGLTGRGSRVFRIEEANPNLVPQIKRILKKNGRLCITIPEGAAPALVEIIESHGFEVSGKPVPEEKKNITETMQGHFKMAKEDPGARPYRIIAVKRTD